jgi:uncharacterized membrane protein
MLMNKKIIHRILTYLIALTWIINGLFCKLLNLVPRHQLIVARILGNDHAGLFTKIIGVLELCMAVWILSSIKPRLCAFAQIIVVTAMNSIEFFLAPDLLLFGKINSIVALVFIIVIYYNEFVLNRRTAHLA